MLGALVTALWGVAAPLSPAARVRAQAQPRVQDPRFAGVARATAAMPRLRSLIVSRGGEVLFEHYARGVSPSRPANIKSASKSLISALVGVALERRLLPDVRTPIATWFPELRRDPDPRKAAITLEDLLTMRAGLQPTSGPNYGAWVTSRNWVQHALSRPLIADPGTGMQYSTGSTHLLSAILAKVTGGSTWAFAQATLGRPLGFTLARWPQDPQGIYFGGNDMLLTPRQMLAFGELYLRRGMVGGQQVIPAAWVDTSCVPRTTSRFDAGREYGYGWWIDEIGDRRACYAWGYGGQYVIVLRDLDAVVVATSATSVDEREERRGYRRALLDLIGTQVVPVLAGTSPRATD